MSKRKMSLERRRGNLTMTTTNIPISTQATKVPAGDYQVDDQD